VQAIATLYHNFPGQRILLVTHSNQALNDLFEKLLERDVPQHQLLRLGAGEKELATEADFSKWGRVNHALSRRLELLGQVQALAGSLGVPGDVGYTCETAEYFCLHHVTSRVEGFRAKFGVPPPPAVASAAAGGALGSAASAAAGGFSALTAGATSGSDSDASSSSSTDALATSFLGTSSSAAAARVAYRRSVAARMGSVPGADVAAAFPFGAFFESAPGGLAGLFPPGALGADALAAAEACFGHLAGLFAELASYRAFELLRSQRARTDFMLTKQARVVAMTCTHAALTRGHLLELGFAYDTLVMEEAAQVTEVETLIPMLLQSGGVAVGNAAAARGGRGGASGGGSASAGAATAVPRLKRVILIGDHHQLPPVVQNTALQVRENGRRRRGVGGWKCSAPAWAALVVLLASGTLTARHSYPLFFSSAPPPSPRRSLRGWTSRCLRGWCGWACPP
jgi:intron-binding protein aquarius